MFDGIGSIRDVNGVGSPNDIRYGMGAAGELEAYAAEEDVDSALVVTDEGVLEAGAADPVFEALEAAGVEVATYDGVTPEPKLALAEAAAEEIAAVDADVVVGVGGGSSMDTAKLASALAEHDVPVRELLGMGNVPGPGRPTILLPTTAGTGSEVTHIGVFADKEDGGNKKVVYSEHLFADLALVDPELTRSLPPQVAAATGMDTLTHAVESYVSTLRTPYTDALARRAIELIGDNLREAVHQGEHNDEARYAMSLAAMLAGQAFVNSGLGAVHALTYPLGTECGLGHGLANAVLLPHVMEYNVPAEPDRFAEIAGLLGVPEREDESTLERAHRSVDAVKALNDDIGIPNQIREVGDVDESQFDAFADIALEHSEHNIERNPRRMDKADIVDVFETGY
ncbi:iron-containing alcohol dehydrogenase [Halopiger aswanensis]|uniref:Alcohol dehydrogenase n=1 Tax=Halopiger aswanensis TaxID=148449 RepID=A0A419WRS0_9EURY|nr:iron-containing alcohol dehydrogenase [Halopiger aswanensis]RKD98117.1 alcohol dehydrogenase [Halopiger aswanensis]